jgi:hypothetical protein
MKELALLFLSIISFSFFASGQEKKEADFWHRSCPKTIKAYEKLDNDCLRLKFLFLYHQNEMFNHKGNISCLTFIISDIEKRSKINANCLKGYVGYMYPKDDSLFLADFNGWANKLCPDCCGTLPVPKHTEPILINENIEIYRKLDVCEKYHYLINNYGTLTAQKNGDKDCFFYIIMDLKKMTNTEANCVVINNAICSYFSEDAFIADCTKWKTVLCP